MSDETYDGLIMSRELSGWKSDIPFSSPGAMGGSCGRYSVAMQCHAASYILPTRDSHSASWSVG